MESQFSRDQLMSMLEKILALTKSPVEGEAQAAALRLQEFLTRYNLDVADIERKGSKAKPTVGKEAHDLGKAAFLWKLHLAQAVAEHFYCYSLIDEHQKTVHFVGRPDNVASLKMLYQWLIDQIRRIATEERYTWMKTNGHVDPLRWQLSFGEGVVDRLGKRLTEEKAKAAADNKVQALVLHHKGEISDWMEEQYGYRIDGQPTKREREREAANKAWQDLVVRDPEAAYAQRPWESPEAKARRKKEDEEWRAEYEKKWRAQEKRRQRTGYYNRQYSREQSENDYRKDSQQWAAREAGRKAADGLNLEPFVNPGKKEDPKKQIKS